MQYKIVVGKGIPFRNMTPSALVQDNSTVFATEEFSCKREDALQKAAEIMCSGHVGGETFNMGGKSFQFMLFEESGKDWRPVIELENRRSSSGFFMSMINSAYDAKEFDKREKFRYLRAIDESSNDYKFYMLFHEQGNNQIGATYGRIGGSEGIAGYNTNKDRRTFYSNEIYWFKYYEKLNKGYVDMTEMTKFEFTRHGVVIAGEKLKEEDKQQKPVQPVQKEPEYAPIQETATRKIIESLIAQQRGVVKANYNYSSASSLRTDFTEKAFETAQKLLKELSEAAERAKEAGDISEFKSTYKKLLLTIPRKIMDVGEYINRANFSDKKSPDYVDKIMEHEQMLLDALRGVVDADKAEQEAQAAQTDEKKQTVLDAHGLQMRTADFSDEFDALEKMGENAHQVTAVLRFRNEKTASRYDKMCETLDIPKSKQHLLWHGSRTENWWSILRTGLSLNPNAIITGKMFGQGIYTAPKAQKAGGYTDRSGSYWAHGNHQYGYMALCRVAVGNPYHPSYVLGSSFGLHNLPDGKDSVWAKAKSGFLWNDEVIVYREEQIDVYALVQTDAQRTMPLTFNVADARKMQVGDVSLTDDGKIRMSVKNPEVFGFPKSKRMAIEMNPDDGKIEVFVAGKSFHEAELAIISHAAMSNFADSKAEFLTLAHDAVKTHTVPKLKAEAEEVKPKRRGRPPKKAKEAEV